MRNIDKFLSLLDGEIDGLLLTSRYSRHYQGRLPLLYRQPLH